MTGVEDAGRTWAQEASKPPASRPGPQHVSALADNVRDVQEALESTDPKKRDFARLSLPIIELNLRNLAAAMGAR